MTNFRNRLLILLAVLTIGVLPITRTAYAWHRMSDPTQGSDTSTGPYSGEPDGAGGSTKSSTQPHGASNLVPSDQGSSGTTVVSRAMWVSSVIRIWAATHFGVGQ